MFDNFAHAFTIAIDATNKLKAGHVRLSWVSEL